MHLPVAGMEEEEGKNGQQEAEVAVDLAGVLVAAESGNMTCSRSLQMKQRLLKLATSFRRQQQQLLK